MTDPQPNAVVGDMNEPIEAKGPTEAVQIASQLPDEATAVVEE